MGLKVHEFSEDKVIYDNLAIEIKTYRYSPTGDIECLSTTLSKLEPLTQEGLSAVLEGITQFNAASREASVKDKKKSWEIKTLITF